MKSKKVCVIDIETINVNGSIGLTVVENLDRAVMSRAAIRFMWMPGAKPVKVPARTPRRSARINSGNKLMNIRS